MMSSCHDILGWENEGGRAAEAGASPAGKGGPTADARARLLPHVIVYDTEIKTDPTQHPGGFEAAKRGECGISCVVLYDNEDGRFHTYDEHDLEECMAHMNTADVLVSFNGLEFDTPLLQSVTGEDIWPQQYDILHEIWKALGTRVKGYKLGDVCGRLGLGAKIADGHRATELYAEGRFGKLFNYCINDVHITRMLARFIQKYGHVLTPDGEILPLPKIEEA